MKVEKRQSVTLIDKDYIKPLGYVEIETNPVDPGKVVLDLGDGVRCILKADTVFVKLVCPNTPTDQNLGIDPNDFIIPNRLKRIHSN